MMHHSLASFPRPPACDLRYDALPAFVLPAGKPGVATFYGRGRLRTGHAPLTVNAEPPPLAPLMPPGLASGAQAPQAASDQIAGPQCPVDAAGAPHPVPSCDEPPVAETTPETGHCAIRCAAEDGMQADDALEDIEDFAEGDDDEADCIPENRAALGEQALEADRVARRAMAQLERRLQLDLEKVENAYRAFCGKPAPSRDLLHSMEQRLRDLRSELISVRIRREAVAMGVEALPVAKTRKIRQQFLCSVKEDGVLA